MIKKFLLSLIILFPLILFSQSVPQIDVVYLKNGTFLKGKVLQVNPEVSILLLVADKETMLIEMKDIERIQKEDDIIPVTKPDKKWVFISEMNGFYGFLQPASHEKDTVINIFGVGLSTIFDAIPADRINLGAGIGFEIWKQRNFVPMFIDFRYYFSETKTAFFGKLNIGYAPAWMPNVKGNMGGALAVVNLGVRIHFDRKYFVTISGGYHLQEYKVLETAGNTTSKTQRLAHLFETRIGIII